jgi:vacuolar-type H+-ATPase subunit C/Vma6
MAQIHLIVEEEESKLIKQKAAEQGLNTSAYIRHVLRDSWRKTNRRDQGENVITTRALVFVLAEAFSRVYKASPKEADSLLKSLLEKFDQRVSQ